MSHPPYPLSDVAQLGHVELYTPKPDESLKFFTEILGLSVMARQGQSVYLRAWGDFAHHTLKLSEAPEAGLGHVAWRMVSKDQLEFRAKALADAGVAGDWIEGDVGHGAAFQFRTPDGHLMELFYEVEKPVATGNDAPLLKNMPQKVPLISAAVRRIDHVNLLCSDVKSHREFLQQHLGFKLREQIIHDRGTNELGAWLSVTPLVHDIAFMKDPTGRKGRFHHLCYWYDMPGDLLRAADIFREYGYKIEAGPAKHAVTNALFLYMYEPGGNRIELFNGGYLIFEPDWEPVVWTEEEKDLRVWWGGSLPESFHRYGTPS